MAQTQNSNKKGKTTSNVSRQTPKSRIGLPLPEREKPISELIDVTQYDAAEIRQIEDAVEKYRQKRRQVRVDATINSLINLKKI